MVHKTPVTFYGLNIFGLKCSEQILGSDLFLGGGVGRKRDWGQKEEEVLPQAVSSCWCDPLDIWPGDVFLCGLLDSEGTD